MDIKKNTNIYRNHRTMNYMHFLKSLPRCFFSWGEGSLIFMESTIYLTRNIPKCASINWYNKKIVIKTRKKILLRKQNICMACESINISKAVTTLKVLIQSSHHHKSNCPTLFLIWQYGNIFTIKKRIGIFGKICRKTNCPIIM